MNDSHYWHFILFEILERYQSVYGIMSQIASKYLLEAIWKVPCCTLKGKNDMTSALVFFIHVWSTMMVQHLICALIVNQFYGELFIHMMNGQL